MKDQSIRIFVASPGDVARERRSLERVVNELNAGVARALGRRLELSRWETDTYPAFHIEGPQAHIEDVLKIEDCDVLICIFSRRFGTPTMNARSGTESEFLRAYRSWKETDKPQIMMYFWKGPFIPIGEEEKKQWNALRRFKRRFPTEGLYWHYGNAREFQDLVRHHLALYLSRSLRAVKYRVPISSLSSQSGRKFDKHYDTSRGEYLIRVASPLNRPGSDLKLPLIDFDFEVVARKVSGSNRSWYGVYIVQGRGMSEVKYHDFFVSGLGTYTYEVKTMDAEESAQINLNIVIGSQLGISVKPGNSINKIRLIRRGSIIEFWVNQERLLELEASLNQREEVRVGIAVHSERNLPDNSHIEVAFKEWVFFEPE